MLKVKLWKESDIVDEYELIIEGEIEHEHVGKNTVLERNGILYLYSNTTNDGISHFFEIQKPYKITSF